MQTLPKAWTNAVYWSIRGFLEWQSYLSFQLEICLLWSKNNTFKFYCSSICMTLLHVGMFSVVFSPGKPWFCWTLTNVEGLCMYMRPDGTIEWDQNAFKTSMSIFALWTVLFYKNVLVFSNRSYFSKALIKHERISV